METSSPKRGIATQVSLCLEEGDSPEKGTGVQPQQPALAEARGGCTHQLGKGDWSGGTKASMEVGHSRRDCSLVNILCIKYPPFFPKELPPLKSHPTFFQSPGVRTRADYTVDSMLQVRTLRSGEVKQWSKATQPSCFPPQQPHSRCDCTLGASGWTRSMLGIWMSWILER